MIFHSNILPDIPLIYLILNQHYRLNFFSIFLTYFELKIIPSLSGSQGVYYI